MGGEGTKRYAAYVTHLVGWVHNPIFPQATHGRYDGSTFEGCTPDPLNALSCKRIIGRGFLPHEVLPLIEATLTNEDETKVIDSLHGNDAQAFVDVVNDVRHHLLSLLWHSLIRFVISVPSLSNFYFLPARLWTSLASPHLFGESV